MPVNTQKSSDFLILVKFRRQVVQLRLRTAPPVEHRRLRIALSLVSPWIVGQLRFTCRQRRADHPTVCDPALRSQTIWLGSVWLGPFELRAIGLRPVLLGPVWLGPV